MKDISKAVIQELKDAEKGRKTSFPFIRHQLASQPMVSDNEQFQVLIVGGSVYKSALLRSKDGEIDIETITEGKQPVFKTKEIFLSFVSKHIAKSVSAVAVNFAFPLVPLFREGRLDGKLGQGAKEHTFDGLMGKAVGKEIEEYIFTKRKQKINVSIANDTICLLLSGLTQYPKENLAAGIVGTGMNFAMFLDDGSAINLEAANFDKFPLSEAAKIVDAASQKPGSALIEKEISGAYLYQVFNAEMKRKGEPGRPIRATDQLDQLASKKNGPASQIAAGLLTRSAQLTACLVAGITMYEKRDMIFNMEGSLFWRGWRYKETVSKTVRELIPEYTVTFANIPNSGILGAAKLVA